MLPIICILISTEIIKILNQNVLSLQALYITVQVKSILVVVSTGVWLSICIAVFSQTLQ